MADVSSALRASFSAANFTTLRKSSSLKCFFFKCFNNSFFVFVSTIGVGSSTWLLSEEESAKSLMSGPEGETFRDEGSTAVPLDATLAGEVGGVFFAGYKVLNNSPPSAV